MPNDVTYSKLNAIDTLEELSSIIKQIHSLVTDVDKLCKRIGTTTDTGELWQNLSQLHQTFQYKVNKCRQLISNVSYVKGLSKYESIQTSRLKKDLNDIVARYTRLQKQISSRERGVIKRSRYRSQETLPVSEEQAALFADEQCQLDGQEILEREQQIRQIEDDMVTVAEMMKEMSYMVHDQGEIVDNIEAHISDARYNAHEGTSLLRKAEQSVKSRRKRNIWILSIFIILLTILIITLVVTRNKK